MVATVAVEERSDVRVGTVENVIIPVEFEEDLEKPPFRFWEGFPDHATELRRKTAQIGMA